MQVDGFRFDIMGHLMLSTMKKIQAALGGLTLDQDGVDGKGLYIYGEAWDFGEVRIPAHPLPILSLSIFVFSADFHCNNVLRWWYLNWR